jgi:hypothetical protein
MGPTKSSSASLQIERMYCKVPAACDSCDEALSANDVALFFPPCFVAVDELLIDGWISRMEHASRKKRLQVIHATQYMQPCVMCESAETNLVDHTQTNRRLTQNMRFCIPQELFFLGMPTPDFPSFSVKHCLGSIIT